jgi:uncharacterized protein (DUF488 family)
MKTIFTIGHSTHPLEEFLAMLCAHRILVLADVRSFPGSRKFPHFGKDALQAAVEGEGLEYRWFKDLGGRRSTKNLSLQNSAWQVAAFHAYADYAQTEPFQTALIELEKVARKRRTAYMCAEALWTRCHRRIISDVLTARGWTVQHIMSAKRLEPHHLAEFARVEKGCVTYPSLMT